MSNYWLDEYKVKVPVVLWANESVTWTVFAWDETNDTKPLTDLFARETETGKTVYMHEYEGDQTVSVWAVTDENTKVIKSVITKDGLKIGVTF